MIPGLHDDDDPTLHAGRKRQRELTDSLGQVTCPVPHVYLFVDGNRCGRCGAQV